MKKYIIIIFILLVGCKSTKDKLKTEVDRTTTETTKKITQRKGDTVTYVVPNIILKDTVITKTNTVTGTTQILRYNEEGKLTAAECISGVVQIIEESNRKVIEAIQESSKHKENEISPMVILYAFIGFAIFIVIILFFVFTYFKKQINTLTGLIPNK